MSSLKCAAYGNFVNKQSASRRGLAKLCRQLFPEEVGWGPGELWHLTASANDLWRGVQPGSDQADASQSAFVKEDEVLVSMTETALANVHSLELSAEDEYPHLEADATIPGWHENWWLTFSDVQQDIHAVLYSNSYVDRPGFVRVLVYQAGRAVFTYEGQHARWARDGNRTRVGPATFTCIDPWRELEFDFDDGDSQFEISWTSVLPPYEWRWAGETGSRHVEQSGLVHGRLTIRGESIVVSGMGQRDRAWGRRDNTRHFQAWSSRAFGMSGEVLHATIVRLRDPEPGQPTTDLLFGYESYGDGSYRLLEELTLDIRHAYPGGPPLNTRLRGTDTDGRVLEHQVRLHGVYPVYHVSGGKESHQFFNFAEWLSEAGYMAGQLDYWWSTSRPMDGAISAATNRGAFVRNVS